MGKPAQVAVWGVFQGMGPFRKVANLVTALSGAEESNMCCLENR